MAKEIDILIVEPGKPPRPARVKNTLTAFQNIVGGPIDIGCYLPQRVMLISNGDAKNLGLPPNRATPRTKDYISGTFFLCSFEGDGFTSLSPAQQKEFQAYFAAPGEFMMVGADTVCTTVNELLMTVCELWERMESGESIMLTKWGGPGGGTPT